MKKLFNIIFFMSFSIIFGLILASCDGIESLGNGNDEQDSHVHSFTGAYLYDEVSHWQECSCGAKSTIVQHSFESKEILLSLNNEKRICRICQYVVNIDLPQEEHTHTYSEEWSSDEYTHYHQAICEHTSEKKDILEHSYGNWIIIMDAQENIAGKQKRVCNVCGYEQVKIIEVLGHTHSNAEEWTIDKIPTCEEPGSKSHHCLTCDEKSDITEIPVLGHLYDTWEIVIEPTLSSKGKITKTCKRNELHTESIELPILNSYDYHHQIIDEPTCETKGYEIYVYTIDEQNIVFSKLIEETGHQMNDDFQIDDHSHWLTCEKCREEISLEEHQYDENFNCTICGYIHNLGTSGLYYILTGDGTSYAVTAYFGMAMSIEIPEKHNNLPVSRIGEEVFSNQYIEEVTLPSSIKKIGDSAFDHCMKLSKINLPEGLIEIGSSAFNSCFNLKAITIPDSVQTIGESAFRACIGLKDLILPDSVQTIGAYAFASCQGLVSLTLSKNLTTLGELAFSSCFDLLMVKIPGTIKVINISTFAQCISLESVVLEEGIERISNDAFGGCKALKKMVLPQSLTHIHNGSLYMCEELKTIYYAGSQAEWTLLTKDGFQHYQCNPVIYTYAETKPTSAGNYWYYDEQNEITKW
ncbi:MAG: leucine-rich repeat domain-containing protein [Anaeroplasmataceae bacterium]|nr:leucine-rich repeat domain-containing protein [Anaeroplasmataceae bacterium]